MTITFALPAFPYRYIHEVETLVVFAALVAVWFFLQRSPALIRSLRAAAWPITGGRIEIARVTAFGDQAFAEVGYSYSVEGNWYSGYYAQQFGDEQHAWSYADSLQDRPVMVRYRRKEPQISALRNVDQQSYVDLRGRSFLGSFFNGLFDHLRDAR